MVADDRTMSGGYLLTWILFRLNTAHDRDALNPLRFALSLSMNVTLIALAFCVTSIGIMSKFGLVTSPTNALWIGITLTVSIAFLISFLVSYEIAKQVKCLSLSHDRYKQLSHTDGLTGLRNRAGLYADSSQLGADYCLAFFDIDHFKSINDNYGHAAGDAVISGVGDRITKAFPQTSLVSRMGGEEFVVTVSGIALDAFILLCEEARKSVQDRPFVADGILINVTVSIGVAASVRDEAFDRALHRADVALYNAKTSGRNRVVSDLNLLATL